MLSWAQSHKLRPVSGGWLNDGCDTRLRDSLGGWRNGNSAAVTNNAHNKRETIGEPSKGTPPADTIRRLLLDYTRIWLYPAYNAQGVRQQPNGNNRRRSGWKSNRLSSLITFALLHVRSKAKWHSTSTNKLLYNKLTTPTLCGLPVTNWLTRGAKGVLHNAQKISFRVKQDGIQTVQYCWNVYRPRRYFIVMV